jgi:uncharacterized protein YhbP (UPF0306 family)
MNEQIESFLNKERIGVISVILDDGTLHSATIHFSYAANPLKFYIQTSNSTLKAQPFMSGKPGKAAMVIGFSEEVWITLQMHGQIRQVSDSDELEEVYKIHYKKQPEAEQYKGPKTVFLEFTPEWWRFTDFNTEPETIIFNENQV